MVPERRLAFGDVAELYDLARPSYPAELVDDVLEFAGTGAGGHALEVGAGTGKATVLFAGRGLRILALEPSSAMARVARENCVRYERVRIEESDFEQWDAREQRFGLLFSAQAWHWIAPELRYARAREVLEPGGTLAVFWNRPNWSACPFRDELADAYRRAAPELGAGAGPGPMHPAVETPPKWWGDWAQEMSAGVGFDRPEVRSYSHLLRYTTREYLALLRTHSDHIVLGAEQLEHLLGAVGDVLERHGGSLELEYLTPVWMTRASSGRNPTRG